MSDDTLTCPYCGATHLDSDGYTEGPRDYHAKCWHALVDSIEQATAAHTSTDSIMIDLRGQVDVSRKQDVLDVLSSIAGEDLDWVTITEDDTVEIDAWDSVYRWHILLDA